MGLGKDQCGRDYHRSSKEAPFTMTRSWSSLPLLLLLLLLLASTTWAQQQHPGQNYNNEDNAKGLGLILLTNPTTINVMWDAVAGTTVYNIEWSEDSGVGGNATVPDAEFYTIKELVPCTDYLVSVQAMKDEVQLENEADTARTTAYASFPVTNLKVTQVDGDATLEVTWDPVTPPGNCELTYIVTWSSSNTSEAGQTNTTEPHYTITGLTYNIAYNVCVAPWVEGETAAQKCKKETTVTSVPGGPPENIVVVNTTSDSIELKWDPPATPNGVITNYSVTWSPDDGAADITDTTYTLIGLLPCTTYTITVSAATSKGYGPPGNTSDATQPIAPGPPTAVTVDMVQNKSDSLTVSWTQADWPGRCNVIKNTVTWWLSSTGALVDSVTVDPTDHYTISGLDPWTTYLVCVRAANQGGDGPDAPCLNQTTDEDIPGGPPENIVVVNTTSDSIELKWDKPATPNGVITNYSVTWSPDDGAADITDTTYTLIGLLPCTTYTIIVSAATSKGYGTPGNTSDATQPIAPGPPTAVTVDMVQNKSDSLTVSWTQAEWPDRCNVIKNTVTWWLSSTGALVDSVTVDPTDHYTISGLDPWTTYLVCVRAANKGGDGPDAPCLNQTTDEDIPGGPPENIMVMNITTESLTVKWDPPAAPNGDITSYLVTWNPEDGTANTTDTIYILTGLLPCTIYTFAVSAATSKGYGPPDNISETTQPTGLPTEVVVDMVEDQSDSLTVGWTQAEQFGKCVITHNIITWWLSSTGALVDSVTVNPTDHYTISGLDPWTTYLVCVRASTLEGDGPYAPCLNQTTDEDIPGPPQNVRVSGTTTQESMTVEWDPPATPNGVITHYSIIWSPNNGTADTTDTSYTLTDLLLCTTYTVIVSAATSKGYGSSGASNFSTATVALAAPENLTDAGHTQAEITVSWEAPPAKPNCLLEYYQISWNRSIGPVTLSPCTTEYTIINLISSTEYNISVAAVNQAGIGPWQFRNISTAPDGSVNVGAIVGGVIGGVVLVTLVALVVDAVVKRKKLEKLVKRNEVNSSDDVNTYRLRTYSFKNSHHVAPTYTDLTTNQFGDRYRK